MEERKMTLLQKLLQDSKHETTTVADNIETVGATVGATSIPSDDDKHETTTVADNIETVDATVGATSIPSDDDKHETTTVADNIETAGATVGATSIPSDDDKHETTTVADNIETAGATSIPSDDENLYEYVLLSDFDEVVEDPEGKDTDSDIKQTHNQPQWRIFTSDEYLQYAEYKIACDKDKQTMNYTYPFENKYSVSDTDTRNRSDNRVTDHSGTDFNKAFRNWICKNELYEDQSKSNSVKKYRFRKKQSDNQVMPTPSSHKQICAKTRNSRRKWNLEFPSIYNSLKLTSRAYHFNYQDHHNRRKVKNREWRSVGQTCSNAYVEAAESSNFGHSSPTVHNRSKITTSSSVEAPVTVDICDLKYNVTAKHLVPQSTMDSNNIVSAKHRVHVPKKCNKKISAKLFVPQIIMDSNNNITDTELLPQKPIDSNNIISDTELNVPYLDIDSNINISDTELNVPHLDIDSNINISDTELNVPHLDIDSNINISDTEFIPQMAMESNENKLPADNSMEDLVCLECGKRFPLKSELLFHLRKVHSLKNLCQLCYFRYFKIERFKNQVYLRHHKLKEHVSDMITCEYCNAKLCNEKLLEIHLKRFKCDQKGIRKKHEESIKQYVECICRKRYAVGSDFYMHKKKCQKLQQLLEAVRDHDKAQRQAPTKRRKQVKAVFYGEEGLYPCKWCGELFKRPYIYIHQKVKHKKENTRARCGKYVSTMV